MPKMKTRRSAAKRFKATATGEFKRFPSHIREHKSPTRKEKPGVKRVWSTRPTTNV